MDYQRKPSLGHKRCCRPSHTSTSGRQGRRRPTRRRSRLRSGRCFLRRGRWLSSLLLFPGDAVHLDFESERLVFHGVPLSPGGGFSRPARRRPGFPAGGHINRSAPAGSQDNSPRSFRVVWDKPPRAYRKPDFSGPKTRAGGKTGGKKPAGEKPAPGTLQPAKVPGRRAEGLYPAKVLRTVGLFDFALRKPGGSADFSALPGESQPGCTPRGGSDPWRCSKEDRGEIEQKSPTNSGVGV